MIIVFDFYSAIVGVTISSVAKASPTIFYPGPSVVGMRCTSHPYIHNNAAREHQHVKNLI